jgi:hypothetical protein
LRKIALSIRKIQNLFYRIAASRSAFSFKTLLSILSGPLALAGFSECQNMSLLNWTFASLILRSRCCYFCQFLGFIFHLSVITINNTVNMAAERIACVAGPQFLGGPDLQRAGFWRARGRIEGLQQSLPFMTTRRSDSER